MSGPSEVLAAEVRRALVECRLVIPMDECERCWLVSAVKEERLNALREMALWEQSGAEAYVSDLENDIAGPEVEYYSDFHASRGYLDSILDFEARLFNTFGFESCFDDEDCRRIREDRIGSALENVSTLEETIIRANISWVGNGERLLSDAKIAFEAAKEAADKYGRANELDYDDGYYQLQDELDAAEEQLRIPQLIVPAVWSSFCALARIPKMRALIPEDCRAFVTSHDRSGFMAWYETKSRAEEKGSVSANEDVSPMGPMNSASENDDYDDEIPF